MDNFNIPWATYTPVEIEETSTPDVISLGEDPLPDLKLKSYQTTTNPFVEQQEERQQFTSSKLNWFDRFLPNEITNIFKGSVEQKISSNDMVKYFVNKGLTHNQARGLVGNLMHESGGGIHNIIQGGKRGALQIDGKTGYGLAQWTSKDRQKGLYNFAKTYTPSKQQQLDYVWHELNNNFKTTLEKLKKTNTVEEATRLIMNEYERPSKQFANYNSRLKFAKSV